MLRYVVLGLSTLLVTPVVSNIAFNATTIANKAATDVNQYKIEQLKYESLEEQSFDESVEYRL